MLWSCDVLTTAVIYKLVLGVVGLEAQTHLWKFNVLVEVHTETVQSFRFSWSSGLHVRGLGGTQNSFCRSGRRTGTASLDHVGG